MKLLRSATCRMEDSRCMALRNSSTASEHRGGQLTWWSNLARPIARTSLCSTRSIGSVGSFNGGFTGVCRRFRERLSFPSKFRTQKHTSEMWCDTVPNQTKVWQVLDSSNYTIDAFMLIIVHENSGIAKYDEATMLKQCKLEQTEIIVGIAVLPLVHRWCRVNLEPAGCATSPPPAASSSVSEQNSLPLSFLFAEYKNRSTVSSVIILVIRTWPSRTSTISSQRTKEKKNRLSTVDEQHMMSVISLIPQS